MKTNVIDLCSDEEADVIITNKTTEVVNLVSDDEDSDEPAVPRIKTPSYPRARIGTSKLTLTPKEPSHSQPNSDIAGPVVAKSSTLAPKSHEATGLGIGKATTSPADSSLSTLGSTPSKPRSWKSVDPGRRQTPPPTTPAQETGKVQPSSRNHESARTQTRVFRECVTEHCKHRVSSEVGESGLCASCTLLSRRKHELHALMSKENEATVKAKNSAQNTSNSSDNFQLPAEPQPPHTHDRTPNQGKKRSFQSPSDRGLNVDSPSNTISKSSGNRPAKRAKVGLSSQEPTPHQGTKRGFPSPSDREINADSHPNDMSKSSGNRPEKRAKLGLNVNADPSPKLKLRLPSLASVSQETLSRIGPLPNDLSPVPRQAHKATVRLRTGAIRNESIVGSHLQPNSLSSSKSRLTVPSSSKENKARSSKDLEEDLKNLRLRIEAERNNSVRAELHKNLAVRNDFPEQFIDETSPWAQIKSKEVPGKQLDIAIVSHAANKSASSVPFRETRCTVEKVPPYKHFEFIKRNVMAPDSRVLRFRRFDMFHDPDKPVDQRAKEEKEHYDLIIESKPHQDAMRTAEDHAFMYKYLPEILRALDCTEAASDSAKEIFARVFKKSRFSLQTLIDCSGKTFDIANFIPNVRLEESSSDQSASQDSSDNNKDTEFQSVLRKDTEPVSADWLLCCPVCQAFQCESHGEIGGNGNINSDLAFLPHLEVLSRQHAVPKKIAYRSSVACSDRCYLSESQAEHQPAPWNAEDVDLLKALVSGSEILPPCLLTEMLDKDCSDIHAHLSGLEKIVIPDEAVPDQPALPRLSWYDNNKKVLKWDNPAETRNHTTDTSIHRHAEMPKIKPCSHEGPCSTEIGGCHEKGLCNKFCLCSDDCPIRFTGCNCAEIHGACSTYRCPCYALGFECDPDLCKSCGAVEHADPRHEGRKLPDGSCKNIALQRAATPLVAIGESTFEGWGYGLFACEDIPSKTFLGEYVGEIVTDPEAERRGIVYEEYFFSLNNEQSIDATRKGNHMRFVNGTFPADPILNCRAQTLSVLGEHRIAFFSTKKIRAGSEIFMDYGRHYEKKHKLHGDGRKLRRENPKKWKLGNHEGQIALILDDDVPGPLIQQELPSRAASKDPTPPRSTMKLRQDPRRTVLESDDSDSSEDGSDVRSLRRSPSLTNKTMERTYSTPLQATANNVSPQKALSLSRGSALGARPSRTSMLQDDFQDSQLNTEQDGGPREMRRRSNVATYNLKVLSGLAAHSPFVKNGTRKSTRDSFTRRSSRASGAPAAKPFDVDSKDEREQDVEVEPTDDRRRSSTKHSADQISGGERIQYACLNCRLKRAKCDKKVPCSRCVEHNLSCAPRYAPESSKVAAAPAADSAQNSPVHSPGMRHVELDEHERRSLSAKKMWARRKALQTDREVSDSMDGDTTDDVNDSQDEDENEDMEGDFGDEDLDEAFGGLSSRVPPPRRSTRTSRSLGQSDPELVSLPYNTRALAAEKRQALRKALRDSVADSMDDGGDDDSDEGVEENEYDERDDDEDQEKIDDGEDAEDDEEEVSFGRPKRQVKMPIQYTRYYGLGGWR